MFLSGTVQPGVITAPLRFDWPPNSLIDKWGGGCISGHSIYFRGECRGAVDYSTCFSNPSPCGRNL